MKEKTKVGQMVKNRCYCCGNPEMQVYEVNSTGVCIWCRCPKCRAVDDIFDWERKAAYEDGKLDENGELKSTV